MSKEQKHNTPSEVNVQIQWDIPSDLPTSWVTNFVVQRLQHEYLVSFFQIIPPILLGTPEQIVEQVAQLDNKIQAKCVYRMVIAPERMQELATLLQDAIELPPAFAPNPSPPASQV